MNGLSFLEEQPISDEKYRITNKIEELLSRQFYCSRTELNGKEIIYSVNTDTDKPYIKIAAYKNCVVICTSEDLYSKVQALLQGKTRDEIFENPFVYGQTIHYVPGNQKFNSGPVPSGYEDEFLRDRDILKLRGLAGFENSLVFDKHGDATAKAVCIARDKSTGKIIGVAGASETFIDGVWEIGIDVYEKHRYAGLGTYLVSKLTGELLRSNIIPFYSASITNISSQRVAHKCGYMPLWIDTYGTILDGSSVYGDIVGELSL